MVEQTEKARAEGEGEMGGIKKKIQWSNERKNEKQGKEQNKEKGPKETEVLRRLADTQLKQDPAARATATHLKWQEYLTWKSSHKSF